MRPDTFGPDAVIADREEDYRVARILAGEASVTRDCAVCGRLVPNNGPDLCDVHLLVPCQDCEGRGRAQCIDPQTYAETWEWCMTCGAQGLVSYAEAVALGWKVAR